MIKSVNNLDKTIITNNNPRDSGWVLASCRCGRQWDDDYGLITGLKADDAGWNVSMCVTAIDFETSAVHVLRKRLRSGWFAALE